MKFVVFSDNDYFFLQAYSTVRSFKQCTYTKKQRTSRESNGGYVSQVTH